MSAAEGLRGGDTSREWQVGGGTLAMGVEPGRFGDITPNFRRICLGSTVENLRRKKGGEINPPELLGRDLNVANISLICRSSSWA